MVLIINKWDLVDKSKMNTKDYAELIKEKIAPFVDVNVLFVSVTEKLTNFKSNRRGNECL